jgi:hypothetical protein
VMKDCIGNGAALLLGRAAVARTPNESGSMVPIFSFAFPAARRRSC